MKDSSKRGSRWPFVLTVVFLLLLGLGFLGPIYLDGLGQSQTRLKLRAKVTLTSLVTSVEAYYNTNNLLPLSGEEPTSKDRMLRTDGELTSILTGHNLNEMNQKEMVFFASQRAKGLKAEEAYNGLWLEGESAKLFDPWKKASSLERGYLVLLDYDGDERLEDPFHPGELVNRRAIAWSSGKDGKWQRGDPYKGVNKDNVYSWF